MTAPTIGEIRQALVTAIESGVSREIMSYPSIPDVTQGPPAVVVSLVSGDYIVNFGMDAQFEFEILVLVPHTNAEVAQETLDALVDYTGPDSIPRAINSKPNLGTSGVDAVIYKMTKYGGSFTSAQIPHIGAVLKTRVEADP